MFFVQSQKFCLKCILLLGLILMQLHSLAFADGGYSLNNVRISYSLAKTRIVCDFNVVPVFKDKFDASSNNIDIYFPQAVNKVKALPRVPTVSRLVQNIAINNDSAGGIHLKIANKQAIKYKVYILNNPVRTVIDIVPDSVPYAGAGSAKDTAVAAVKDDGNSTYSTQLGKGLTYQKMIKYTGDGPVKAFVLRVAPNADYKVIPALSNGVVSGLATLSNIVQENNAIAGVNGSYFNTDGQILGLLMINGEFASTADVLRTSIGFWPNGSAAIDQIEYKGSVLLPNGKKVVIDGVNRERGDNMLVLYNRYYDQSTDTNGFGMDYVVKNGKVTDIKQSDAAIPQDGVVLSVHGAAAEAFSGVQVGDKVLIEQKLESSFNKAENVVGAGPFLVRNGKPFITSKVEEFPSDITIGRAPRTAVGITADGGILLLVLDGRQRDSIGMTLQELTNFLIELGAVNALNMDGGGSSEMYVSGQVVNSPSDGRERRVGDAILVVKK